MSNIIPGGFKKPNPLTQHKQQAQMMNRQQAMQMLANYVAQRDSDYEDVVCECGSRHYDHCVRKKRISPMDPANPQQGTEKFIDIIVNVCKGCGKEIQLNGPGKNVTFAKPEGLVK